MGTKTYPGLTVATSTNDSDLSAIWQSGAMKQIDNDLFAEYVNRNSPTAEFIETLIADKDYSVIETDHRIISNSSSGDITIGLFNGATRLGATVIIQSIGTGNKTYVELASSGTADFYINPGKTVLLIWDGTVWRIDTVFLDEITASKDYSSLKNSYKIIADCSSGDITIGLFNGADKSGTIIFIQIIGSANQVDIELVSDGVTTVTLNPNELLLAIWDGASWKWYNRRTQEENSIGMKKDIITSTQTLELYKRYFAIGDMDLTLPSLANEGDMIDIFAEGYVNILQPNAESIISYLDKYLTTKGTSGYLALSNQTKCSLVYKGATNYILDPMEKLPDPATFPPGTPFGGGASSDVTYIIIGTNTSPYMIIYKRTGTTLSVLSNPTTTPTDIGKGAAFNGDAVYSALAARQSSLGRIFTYKRTDDTFANLVTLDATYGVGVNISSVSFSTDGVYLAGGHNGTASEQTIVIKRTGDTFAKLTALSPQTGTNTTDVSFSGDGIYLACSDLASPYIHIYKRTGDVFAKLSNPTNLPNGAANSCSFSVDGNYLFVSHSGSPYLTIYKRDGDTFNKISNAVDIAPVGTMTEEGIKSNYDGSMFILATDASPNIYFYKRIAGDKFIQLPNPDTLPGVANGVGSFIDRTISQTNYGGIIQAGANEIPVYSLAGSADNMWIAELLETVNQPEDIFI